MHHSSLKILAQTFGLGRMSNLNLYIYTRGGNIGDVAGFYILKKYFPEITFNPDSKKYLFFGGSTFYCHHYIEAEQIVYFGNGLSGFDELVPPKHPFTIYPRGHITKNMLERSGVKCKQVMGDIIQFLAQEDTAIHDESLPALYIKDAFKNVDFIPTHSPVIGVCDTSHTKGLEIVSDIDIFKEKIGLFGKVISSQVHPFLIALMFGKPAKLIAKDFRALDICDYFDIPLDCTVEDSMRVRETALKNIPHMKDIFMEIINNHNEETI
jgi:hypothetical protein